MTSLLHILRRATLLPEWMLDNCIKVNLNGLGFFAPKESELTFHSEVCYLLVYYYSVVHMYLFLSIPMIIVSSNIQQKVLKVRKL